MSPFQVRNRLHSRRSGFSMSTGFVCRSLAQALHRQLGMDRKKKWGPAVASGLRAPLPGHDFTGSRWHPVSVRGVFRRSQHEQQSPQQVQSFVRQLSHLPLSKEMMRAIAYRAIGGLMCVWWEWASESGKTTRFCTLPHPSWPALQSDRRHSLSLARLSTTRALGNQCLAFQMSIRTGKPIRPEGSLWRSASEHPR